MGCGTRPRTAHTDAGPGRRPTVRRPGAGPLAAVATLADPADQAAGGSRPGGRPGAPCPARRVRRRARPRTAARGPSFGDVAGPVDPQERERHAPSPGALQGAHPVVQQWAMLQQRRLAGGRPVAGPCAHLLASPANLASAECAGRGQRPAPGRGAAGAGAGRRAEDHGLRPSRLRAQRLPCADHAGRPGPPGRPRHRPRDPPSRRAARGPASRHARSPARASIPTPTTRPGSPAT